MCQSDAPCFCLKLCFVFKPTDKVSKNTDPCLDNRSVCPGLHRKQLNLHSEYLMLWFLHPERLLYFNWVKGFAVASYTCSQRCAESVVETSEAACFRVDFLFYSNLTTLRDALLFNTRTHI